jgi:nucleotide-binding universal stress UspA family protein
MKSHWPGLVHKSDVVVVDGSASSRIAADWAAGEAELRRLPLRVVRPSALPDEQLLSLAAQADCTVLWLRGTGGYAGLPVGSVAHDGAQRSDRPVVLVPRGSNRGRSGRRPDWVALAIDARDPAGDVVDFAFEAAQRRRALFHAVHAW